MILMLIFFLEYLKSLNIDLLCLINEYFENKLKIMTHTKLYKIDYERKIYVYYYESNVEEAINNIIICIKHIKKIK